MPNNSYVSFKVGANVLVVRNEELLLVKRRGGFGEGDWGLPGGHLESGESLTEAARRELLEETGLTCEIMEFVNLVNDVREDGHRIQVGFMASGVVGEPEIREPDRCAEWQWFDFKELPENLFVAHLKSIQLFVEGSKSFADA